eukprot:TRINITY_DN5540_c0_g2_i2.p1 TRINITY_DN5540_c0_g2~~TRINITY_DN5540_c0_g2_i2.p1  ORF type:complete len:114 (-),score=2.66 TRINITY_DN5540_c0_g2_i2:198-539(-)
MAARRPPSYVSVPCPPSLCAIPHHHQAERAEQHQAHTVIVNYIYLYTLHHHNNNSPLLINHLPFVSYDANALPLCDSATALPHTCCVHTTPVSQAGAAPPSSLLLFFYPHLLS